MANYVKIVSVVVRLDDEEIAVFKTYFEPDVEITPSVLVAALVESMFPLGGLETELVRSMSSLQNTPDLGFLFKPFFLSYDNKDYSWFAFDDYREVRSH